MRLLIQIDPHETMFLFLRSAGQWVSLMPDVLGVDLPTAGRNTRSHLGTAVHQETASAGS